MEFSSRSRQNFFCFSFLFGDSCRGMITSFLFQVLLLLLLNGLVSYVLPKCVQKLWFFFGILELQQDFFSFFLRILPLMPTFFVKIIPILWALAGYYFSLEEQPLHTNLREKERSGCSGSTSFTNWFQPMAQRWLPFPLVSIGWLCLLLCWFLYLINRQFLAAEKHERH